MAVHLFLADLFRALVLNFWMVGETTISRDQSSKPVMRFGDDLADSWGTAASRVWRARVARQLDGVEVIDEDAGDGFSASGVQRNAGRRGR